jgi:tellurite resistance protein
MSELPAASATIEIERSIAVVRAHFLDLDDAIRRRIHHGVALRWLAPATPGELRVEQETRALGRPQVEAFVLEEGPDDGCTHRFVAGPNTGARLVATFAAISSGTTVRLAMHAGPGGYRTGVGKLSAVGIEKLLQKTLEEHKAALVGYEPGRARGAVAAVLAPLRKAVLEARAKQRGDARAVMTNLLEAACAVAVSDGQADDAERSAIQEVARELCFLDLDGAAVDRMVANVAAAVKADGLEARCDKIAARLAALELGEVGLGVAALVAEVSHGIGLEEHAALARLASALGLGEAALDERLRVTDRALGGV